MKPLTMAAQARTRTGGEILALSERAEAWLLRALSILEHDPGSPQEPSDKGP